MRWRNWDSKTIDHGFNSREWWCRWPAGKKKIRFLELPWKRNPPPILYSPWIGCESSQLWPIDHCIDMISRKQTFMGYIHARAGELFPQAQSLLRDQLDVAFLGKDPDGNNNHPIFVYYIYIFIYLSGVAFERICKNIKLLYMMDRYLHKIIGVKPHTTYDPCTSSPG